MSRYFFNKFAFLFTMSLIKNSSEKSYNVIIVGSGLAGSVATIVAAERGHSVYWCEKESRLGGNSAKATSGINAAESRLQKSFKTDDSILQFAKDTYKSAGELGRIKMINLLTQSSPNAVNFLESRLGVDFDQLVKLGGHSNTRTHKFKPDEENNNPKPLGFSIMTLLRKMIKSKVDSGDFNVDLATDVRMTNIEKIDGNILMTAKSSLGEFNVTSKSIIVTTGGFANDRNEDSLILKYAEKLYKLPTTSGSWATGDGMKILKRIGAKMVDMDQIQIHPTGFLTMEDASSNVAFLAPESLRGCGGKLILKNGKRFVNELEKRDVVTNAIFEHGFEISSDGRKGAYLIISEKDAACFGITVINFYVKFKRMSGPLTVDQMAQFVQTSDVDYPNVEENSKFYIGLISPVLHYCMGGVAINGNAQVLSEDDSPIEGIYAAGEVTGGIHGKNRLGGNSLLDCVVFGKIAAESCSKYIKMDQHGEL